MRLRLSAGGIRVRSANIHADRDENPDLCRGEDLTQWYTEDAVLIPPEQASLLRLAAFWTWYA